MPTSPASALGLVELAALAPELWAVLLVGAGILLALGGLVVFALIWMAGGSQRPRTIDVAPLELHDVLTTVPTGSGPIRVVTWNMSWGYGFGSEGSGRARPRAWFESSLERMGKFLADAAVDVVLLQEVDFDATRSHGMDQAAILARAAGLRFIAPAPSWTARWIPFPYWPPSEHFGRMSSGGAILSRFPVRTNTVELLPKPARNPDWYNLFYLFRYLQRAELVVGGATIRVVNVHLEAFDPSARQLQAEHLRDQLTREGAHHTVVGGDLNTVPPEQTIRRAYPDEPDTNHEDDRTLDHLRSVPGLVDTVPPEHFRSREAEWFTFPAHAPNRKLDHLLVGTGLRVVTTRVAREAGDTSDHLPLLLELEIV